MANIGENGFRRMAKRKELEVRMRSLEWFHRERVLPGLWLIVRLDGRAFGRFTAPRFEKPFDPRMRDLMCGTARALLIDFNGLYAYTMSDEISLLLPRRWDLFGGVVEKIVSISAGLASAAFTQACGEPAHSDSRVWLGVDEEAVIDYFRWRQADAARNALHSWCYWTLRKSGVSVAEAVRHLDRSTASAKRELLMRHGVTFDKVPAWQCRGVGIYWQAYEKEGYDPIMQRPVVTRRRGLAIDIELPMNEAYDALLCRTMQAAEDASLKDIWQNDSRYLSALSRKAIAASSTVEKTAVVTFAPGRGGDTSLPPCVPIKAAPPGRRWDSAALPGTFVTTFIQYHGKFLPALARSKAEIETAPERVREQEEINSCPFAATIIGLGPYTEEIREDGETARLSPGELRRDDADHRTNTQTRARLLSAAEAGSFHVPC